MSQSLKTELRERERERERVCKVSQEKCSTRKCEDQARQHFSSWLLLLWLSVFMQPNLVKLRVKCYTLQMCCTCVFGTCQMRIWGNLMVICCESCVWSRGCKYKKYLEKIYFLQHYCRLGLSTRRAWKCGNNHVLCLDKYLFAHSGITQTQDNVFYLTCGSPLHFWNLRAADHCALHCIE